MRAWVFQDHRQKEKLGDKAPWSAGWVDPEGKRRSKRIGSKSMAEKYARKKEGELAAGLLQTGGRRISWEKFQREYEEMVMPRWRSEMSRVDAKHALETFSNLSGVKQLDRVDARTLDQYVAKRLQTPGGKKKGDTISVETVRKELRTIRAALNCAKKWKYLAECPDIPQIEGYGKDKPFVTEEHFNAIMDACRIANMPADQKYTAEAFWHALLATAWVTGMRKSALISLLWEDVDLDGGVALSRYGDNKAKRDQHHKIASITGFLANLYACRKPGETRVFPWNYCLKGLDRMLARIQKAAGIHLPCREDHEHTEACHLYGFHSFRYAHATYNFGRVSDRDLQEQMGHATFSTKQRYIKYAETHQQRVYDVFLPKSLKVKVG
jgi:integrase